MAISLSTAHSVVKVIEGRPQTRDDRLAVEEPLEIRIGAPGQVAVPLAVTMRTPGHDADLAAGFCLTEGIVTHGDQVERIERCSQDEHGNTVNVTLDAETSAQRASCVASAQRDLYMSSSCGICGKRSVENIRQKVAPIVGDFTVNATVLGALPAKMRSAQPTFETTGGLHAAALFDPAGGLLVLREDVGRHNAVDKVIGHMLMLGRVPLDRVVLLVSGRGSFEIVQKAAVAGIAMIAAVGAPSSLAVELAEEVNMTLVGFLREDRMNVYAHPQRVEYEA